MRVLERSMVKRGRSRSVHKIRADASHSNGTPTLNRSCSARSRNPESEQRNNLDHSTHNAEVGGSSPPVATSIIIRLDPLPEHAAMKKVKRVPVKRVPGPINL